MSSVADTSLSKSDTQSPGNVQAGLGNGVLETGNEILFGDRGLESKVIIEPTKNEIGLQINLSC